MESGGLNSKIGDGHLCPDLPREIRMIPYVLKIPLKLPCFVDMSLISSKQGYQSGEIVMMSWRMGRKPVFDFMFSMGGMYCDLPLHAFHLKGPSGSISLNLVPTHQLKHYPDNFWTGVYPSMLGGTYTIFGKGGRIHFLNAKYLLSCELDKNNDLFHFMSIGSGYIGMFANQYVMRGLHLNPPKFNTLNTDYSQICQTST